MSTSAKLVCMLLSVITSTVTLGASPTGTLKGTVTDSEGAAISGAHILVRWDSSGSGVGLKSNLGLRHDLSFETDNNGQFMSLLPPGFYDVFVSANAFSPECRKIRVNAGEAAIYKPRLKVDPLVTKEIGHRVPK